jgi:hypothetical protein
MGGMNARKKWEEGMGGMDARKRWEEGMAGRDGRPGPAPRLRPGAPHDPGRCIESDGVRWVAGDDAGALWWGALASGNPEQPAAGDSDQPGDLPGAAGHDRGVTCLSVAFGAGFKGGARICTGAAGSAAAALRCVLRSCCVPVTRLCPGGSLEVVV